MNSKLPRPADVDFTEATVRATRVRSLYRQLEEQNHKTAWTTEEDMLAFVSDVGVLARLVMASEGRWVHGGDVPAELKAKVAECQWWLLVLADRLGVDMTESFKTFIDKLDADLKA